MTMSMNAGGARNGRIGPVVGSTGQPSGVLREGTFAGVVKQVKDYTFIDCSETKQMYGKDVFVLKSLASGLRGGEQVYFTMVTNEKGQPQARDIFPARPGAGGSTTTQTPGGYALLGPAPPTSPQFDTHNHMALLQAQAQAQQMMMVPGGFGGDMMAQQGYQQFMHQPPAGSDTNTYIGTVKSLSHKYGFADCQQAKDVYGQDTFLLPSSLPEGLQVGDPIQFTVTLNARSQPQACSVIALRSPQAADQSAMLAAQVVQAQQQGGAFNDFNAFSQSAGVTPMAASSAYDAPVEGGMYEGTLKSLSQKYGFIECEPVKAMFGPQDVFLLASNFPEGIAIGDRLRFALTQNAKGQPQATDVSVVGAAVGAKRGLLGDDLSMKRRRM